MIMPGAEIRSWWRRSRSISAGAVANLVGIFWRRNLRHFENS